MLQAHILPTISFDVSDCPGAVTASGSTQVSFDVTHLAIMGHSMGATIAPLTVALEPAFKSVVLSGAGSSWIENVLYKELPLYVKPALEILLDYNISNGQVMTEYDPALSLFQWAIESADPQVYDSEVIDAPVAGASSRQVLMFQGIVDHYILPDIANATTLTLGLDMAGAELDQSPEEPAGQTLVSTVLPLVGHGDIPLPASGNLTAADGSKVTGVLVQAPGDAIEDGHEVVFQTDGPKHQYQCFLASTLTGVATVPVAASVDAGCP
jgi:pimeloyl-ACP methyl ester carboxylesterase